MRVLPFHCLCIFALIIRQNSLSDHLQCFLCEGPCNCQGRQLSQKCVPNDRLHHPRCYSVKSVLTGQVLRKGCSADCESVEVSGWQKCQLCEGQMCNKNDDDDVSKTFLLNDCQMSQFFGALQTIHNNFRRESGLEGAATRDASSEGHLEESSQFVNGIDSSLFSPPKNKMQMAKTEFQNVLERMSPSSEPIGLGKNLEPDRPQLVAQFGLPLSDAGQHFVVGQNLAQKTAVETGGGGPSRRVEAFGQQIERRQNSGGTTVPFLALNASAATLLFTLIQILFAWLRE
uniref:Uncharacterized protein n=1 Tax=Globodera rostochiensis TaxID=31243 RepID=A0A914H7X9_GLORO